MILVREGVDDGGETATWVRGVEGDEKVMGKGGQEPRMKLEFF